MSRYPQPTKNQPYLNALLDDLHRFEQLLEILQDSDLVLEGETLDHKKARGDLIHEITDRRLQVLRMATKPLTPA